MSDHDAFRFNELGDLSSFVENFPEISPETDFSNVSQEDLIQFIKQQPELLPMQQPPPKEQEIVLPYFLVIHLPTIAQIEPYASTGKNGGKISIYIEDVRSYTIGSKAELMFRATLLTSPVDHGLVTVEKYNDYLEAVASGKETIDYHFQQIAPMRWFSSLTGTTDVRVKIMNSLANACGGFVSYPYIPTRIKWIKKPSDTILKIIGKDNPDMPREFSDIEINPKIPKCWMERAMTKNCSKILSPSYLDSTHYDGFQICELGYKNGDVQEKSPVSQDQDIKLFFKKEFSILLKAVETIATNSNNNNKRKKNQRSVETVMSHKKQALNGDSNPFIGEF